MDDAIVVELLAQARVFLCCSSAPTEPLPATGIYLDMHPVLSDAQWFPIDLHVPSRVFSFAEIGSDVVERENFLDTRMEIAWDERSLVDAAAIARALLPRANVGWIFHTSFCCSTLLSRALHLSEQLVVLKEPLVLRRLADARHGKHSIDGLVAASASLLARPWRRRGSVIIKPTHAALNIAGDLLHAIPGSRGVLLTSSLHDFLLSNIKKSEEIQRKIPLLVERAFAACTLGDRLPPTAFDPPDILAAAALQWAAQREVCLDLVEAFGADTLRVLDASQLLADLGGTSWRCAQWLRLPVSEEALEHRVRAVSQQNAKAVEVAYSAEHRAAEARMLQANYGEQVDRAMRWFERNVGPAMRSAALGLTDTEPHLQALRLSSA